MKRYDWENRLIDAQASGLISDGALLVALKLAKVINWSPKDREAGLYWKNQDAFDEVGIARATYFRHRESLFETGFFIAVNGNLIPQLPDLSQIETANGSVESQIETVIDSQESQIETVIDSQESQIETKESQIETEQSQIETPESQLDNPFSVDTLSEEICSEDSLSVGTVADAPVDSESSPSQRDESIPNSSLLSERSDDEGNSSLDSVEITPESQIETWEQRHQRVEAARYAAWAGRQTKVPVIVMEDW